MHKALLSYNPTVAHAAIIISANGQYTPIQVKTD